MRSQYCGFCGRWHPADLCLEAMACAFSQDDLDFFALEEMWNLPARGDEPNDRNWSAARAAIRKARFGNLIRSAATRDPEGRTG